MYRVGTAEPNPKKNNFQIFLSIFNFWFSILFSIWFSIFVFISQTTMNSILPGKKKLLLMFLQYFIYCMLKLWLFIILNYIIYKPKILRQIWIAFLAFFLNFRNVEKTPKKIIKKMKKMMKLMSGLKTSNSSSMNKDTQETKTMEHQQRMIHQKRCC